ncbi:MAG TPA: AMMECR1 domain-containing protein [Firmicutes bacterium]|nr:AMMECR1 domain-containing protein [Bacillota bacterium]
MTQFYLMPHPPVMVPSVGEGREKEIQATIDAAQYIKEKIARSNIETIIVITPHGPLFRDAIALMSTDKLSGDLAKFGVPQESLTFNVDVSLCDEILRTAEEYQSSFVGLTEESALRYRIVLELDHGAYVPLSFVADPSIHKIVHLTYGFMSPLALYEAGMVIKKAIMDTDTDVAVIASGDLSHCLTKDGPYPYHPSGANFDRTLMEVLKRGNFVELLNLPPKLISDAGECGLRSLYILAGCMDGCKVSGNVLSYEGPFGVGYGVVEFHCKQGPSIYKELKDKRAQLHESRLNLKNPYTTLARRNLDCFYQQKRELEVTQDLPKELLEHRRGVFVSVKKDGQLRGCIGTFLPTTDCIAQEIINNSLSAALNDPRFPPVQPSELNDLDISVDVLEAPEVCQKEDLDPRRYGVIVSKGYKRGLLLPMLEGIDTVEQQLQIALEKGDIDEFDNYVIERFEVTRYSEVDDE